MLVVTGMSLYPILSISVHFYQFLPISTNFCPFLPISAHFYPFLPISKHFYTFPHNSTLNKLVLHTICQCDRSEWVSDLRIFVLLITGTISIAASPKLFCVCIIVLYIIYLPFDVKIAAIVRGGSCRRSTAGTASACAPSTTSSSSSAWAGPRACPCPPRPPAS